MKQSDWIEVALMSDVQFERKYHEIFFLDVVFYASCQLYTLLEE